MKKFYAILKSSLLLLFMLYSCSKDTAIPTPGGPEKPDEPKQELELQYTKVNLPCLGGGMSVDVYTNLENWTAEITGSNKSWLTLETAGNKITLRADKANTTGAKLNTTITVKTGSKDKPLIKELEVYQNTDAMIFEYTVKAGDEIRLPIFGKVDCRINWGDGLEESCQKENIDNFFTMSPTHIYFKAGTYQVAITGQVSALKTGLGFTEVQSGFITGVVQWGNVGLVNMASAFSFCRNLTKIAGDDDMAFSKVTSFNGVFSSTGLLEIPENLFQYATQATSINDAFNKTAITTIPGTLLHNCVNVEKMSSLFSYTPIRGIPEELFSKNPKVTTFSNCFTGCAYLRSIPEKLFYNNPLVEDFSYIFRDCGGITTIPENLFSKNPEAGNMVGLFTFCYSLTSIPGKLFASNPLVYKFTYAFANCTSLKSFPAELFDNCRQVLSFQGAMRECHSITGETPYTVIDGKKVHLYERSKYPTHFLAPEIVERCFQNSTGFTDYQTIANQYPAWVK